MAAQPDTWAALLAAEITKPGRPSPDALTFHELAAKLGMGPNGARNWAERMAAKGKVRLVSGRSEKNNRTTVYVVPV